MPHVIDLLTQYFGDDILNKGNKKMLSNHQNFSRTKIICDGPVCYGNYQCVILNETLIDHFFKIFNTQLIYTEKNKDVLINKLHDFLSKNGLDILIDEDNSQPINGRLEGNTIHVNFPKGTTEKEIVYVILHELSHYITNTASSDKLKKFIIEPLKTGVNINNVFDIQKELNYFLSPAELSNWAFTLSIALFEENYKSAKEFHKIVKEQIKNIDSIDLSPELFKTKIYNSINAQDLKALYHLIIYVHQLKILKLERQQRIKYYHKLMSLIKILDKYVKRLNRLFKKS